MTDVFTKFSWAVPARDQKANTSARLLVREWFQRYGAPIDVLNKDCRRSISAILTWVLENVKISVRPLNSIGN